MKKQIAYTCVLEAQVFSLFTRLLMIAKSKQANSGLEERRLRFEPRGKRRFDDIEF